MVRTGTESNAGVPPRVSVIIKALNEQERIGAAVQSALEAVAKSGGEVILADSLSTDRTVEIAADFPITIVQLTDPGDRRCGVGPQLGYQYSRGEYVYILDGDMELDPDFLGQALEAMEEDPGLGGVGGLIEEQSTASYQFRGRKNRRRESVAGEVGWLDMGGLYRRAALEEVGYFSDRDLHAYEEMELGLRLGDAGWRLRRLPVRSVRHYGYTEDSWALLRRRWRSRYLDGAGELLRVSLGRRYWFRAARAAKHLFVGLALWLLALAGLVALPVTPWILVSALALTLLLIGLRALRIRSLKDSLFAQLVWQVTSLAMLRGFLRSPRDPREPVAARVLQSAGPSGREPAAAAAHGS